MALLKQKKKRKTFFLFFILYFKTKKYLFLNNIKLNFKKLLKSFEFIILCDFVLLIIVSSIKSVIWHILL